MQIFFNTQDFFKRWGVLENEMTNAGKMAIEDVVLDLFEKSQKVVPRANPIAYPTGIVPGALEDSGHFYLPGEIDDNGYVVYGGEAIAYAIYQHEGIREDGSHEVKNWTTPGRNKKYLEDPIKDNLPHYQKVYGAVFADVLRK